MTTFNLSHPPVPHLNSETNSIISMWGLNSLQSFLPLLLLMPLFITPPPSSFYIQEARATFRKNKQEVSSRSGQDQSGCIQTTVLLDWFQCLPMFSRFKSASIKYHRVFKDSIIIPVSKSTKISSLTDLRPTALMSAVMKTFECIFLSYLKSYTASLMDTYQFGFRANRSVEDAVDLALHQSPQIHAHILFNLTFIK